MSAALNCRLIRYLADHRGRLWDRNYIHLIGPAMITLGTDGHGKIAVQGATSRPRLQPISGPLHMGWI
ncbi:hypothetical protein C770_GR4pB167 (plasmid) [Sinorhizobium meliloti GR4]|nr:hypothetical protein C770_GR4pB167 [Sinorhizobium meliloti GR4]